MLEPADGGTLVPTADPGGGRPSRDPVNPEPLNAGCQRRISSCPAERALCLLGEVLKGARVFDRQVGEDLAIQFNASFLQTADELAVAHAVQLGGGANADDPQRAVLALLLFTPGVGKLQAALDGFFGGAIEFRFCEEVTTGAL